MTFLGDNVKIHFAGSDGEEIFHAALKAADINIGFIRALGSLTRNNLMTIFCCLKTQSLKFKTGKRIILFRIPGCLR